ncbi:YwqG family protein, partial [Sphingopyxis sp. HXXIV]
EGQEWPVDGDGRPFDFVAQVDFEHLPALDGFPATGVLQFFTQREDIMGVDFDHPDRSVIRLIWHPNGLPAGGLVPPPPQDEPTGPLTDATRDTGITLVASPAMHQPSFNDFRVEGLIDGLGNRPNFKVIDDWLYDPAHEEPMVHHVGGHPAFTQFDFRRPRHLDDYDRTLLRLTSDDHIFWGDVGEAVFLIRAADLAARDFSRVAFSWDCH